MQPSVATEVGPTAFLAHNALMASFGGYHTNRESRYSPVALAGTRSPLNEGSRKTGGNIISKHTISFNSTQPTAREQGWPQVTII